MLISDRTVPSAPHVCICLLWQWVLVWLPWKRSWIWPQFSGSKTGLFSKPASVLSNLKLAVTWTGSESLEYGYFQQSEAFPNGCTDSQCHWGDTSADHLVQLHCSEPCHAGFWVSPKTEASQLLWMTSSSIDDPHSEKSVGLFFVFWVIFWVIHKLFPDFCVTVLTRWTVQEAARLLPKLHSLSLALWSKTRDCTIGFCPKNNGLIQVKLKTWWAKLLHPFQLWLEGHQVFFLILIQSCVTQIRFSLCRCPLWMDAKHPTT